MKSCEQSPKKINASPDHVPRRNSKISRKKFMMLTKQLPKLQMSTTYVPLFSPVTVFNLHSPTMYKTALRSAPRRIVASRSTLNNTSSSAARRFLSTAPPNQKGRTWKSSVARWGLAIGGIYYYNTSTVFAKEPEGEPESSAIQLVK
jgi:hypothetical protein